MSTAQQKSPDPSPEQIRQACLQIQAGWTEDERLKRLRVDWRFPADNKTALEPVTPGRLRHE